MDSSPAEPLGKPKKTGMGSLSLLQQIWRSIPDPGIEPGSPALQADSIPTELTTGSDNPRERACASCGLDRDLEGGCQRERWCFFCRRLGNDGNKGLNWVRGPGPGWRVELSKKSRQERHLGWNKSAWRTTLPLKPTPVEMVRVINTLSLEL